MKIELISSIVLSLGVWRISALLVYERGPFEIFERMRKAAGITHDDSHEPIAWDENKYFAKLLECIWCTSLTVALVVGVLFFLFGDVIVYLLFPFFLGSLVIGYERIING